jgi:hypothetical protein
MAGVVTTLAGALSKGVCNWTGRVSNRLGMKVRQWQIRRMTNGFFPALSRAGSFSLTTRTFLPVAADASV